MRHLCMLLFVLVTLGGIAFGQVTVTPQGFATSSGVAIPATPLSPPLLYTPSVHLGDAPIATVEVPPGVVAPPASQLGYVTSGPSWAPAWQIASGQPGSETILMSEQAQAPPPTQTSGNVQAAGQRFNFGIAQFDSPYSRSLKDENRSVAEIAAAAKKHKKAAVRTYSNEDIEKLKR